MKRHQISLACQWLCSNWAGRDFWRIAEGTIFNPWTKPTTAKSVLFEFDKG